MKRLISLSLLAILGFLMNLVSSSGASLFSKSEMRDVNRRLDSIGGL